MRLCSADVLVGLVAIEFVRYLGWCDSELKNPPRRDAFGARLFRCRRAFGATRYATRKSSEGGLRRPMLFRSGCVGCTFGWINCGIRIWLDQRCDGHDLIV